MNSNQEPQWHVCISGNSLLNFVMFVGCTFNLCNDDKRTKGPFDLLSSEPTPSHHLVEAWGRWRDDTILACAEGGALVLDPVEPPHFMSIADLGLRELCVRAWPIFLNWWYMPAGGQAALSYWEGVPPVHHFVTRCRDELQDKFKGFKLEIQLVYAGIREPVEVTKGLMIMPVGSKLYTSEDWWLATIKDLCV